MVVQLAPRVVVQNTSPQQRVTRSPRHNFNVRMRPYQIQPFMIAPVLPGETLTTAALQARCKTDPLAASVDLLGWWLEHYIFYVKLTDLAGRDDFTEMLLSFGHDLSAYHSAANVQYMHGGRINWAKLCTDRIVDEWFRDEGDGTVTFDGMHQAQIMGETWLESAKLTSQTGIEDHDLPGEQVHEVPTYYSGTDFATHYAQWRHMTANKLTSATFEDWVSSFGIRTDSKPERTDYRPELLMRSKDFQYPSVIVDGATATSTAAVVWSVAASTDKRRLFREPGFLVGVTLARPKVYLSAQTSAAVQMMDDAYAWLPAVLKDEPYTSLKNFADTAGVGPLGAAMNEAYWVDIRDLFLYGDQFVNWDMSTSPAGTVALPTAAMQKKYAAETQINNFFASPATATARLVRQDGICNLSILGMQIDQT